MQKIPRSIGSILGMAGRVESIFLKGLEEEGVCWKPSSRDTSSMSDVLVFGKF
jgi:hypothetical protein